MKKFFTKIYDKLPHWAKGGLMLAVPFVILLLLIGTIVFLCTPNVHLNIFGL